MVEEHVDLVAGDFNGAAWRVCGFCQARGLL